MLKTLKHARLDHTYDAELRKLIAVDLLILDDFAIDVLDPTESRDLYDPLLERYRTGSIVVTSNRGHDEWLATFADPLRAQIAIDRFTSNAYDLIDGESCSASAQAEAPEGGQGARATTGARESAGALGGSPSSTPASATAAERLRGSSTTAELRKDENRVDCHCAKSQPLCAETRVNKSRGEWF
jgi:hypothetical protein